MKSFADLQLDLNMKAQREINIYFICEDESNKMKHVTDIVNFNKTTFCPFSQRGNQIKLNALVSKLLKYNKRLERWVTLIN